MATVLCLYKNRDGSACSLPSWKNRSNEFCVFHRPVRVGGIDFREVLIDLINKKTVDDNVETISFEGFYLRENVLQSIEFNKSVSFENAKFENIEVKDCRFLGDKTDFFRSTFSGKSKISNVYFENRVTNFISNHFTGVNLLFSESLFNSDNTVFSDNRFDCGIAVFDVITIRKGMTRFSDNTFSKGVVNFEVVQFDSTVNNFSSNVFEAENVRLQNVAFSGQMTNFKKNNFKTGTTRLSNCSFKSDLTVFDETEIRSPLIFQGYTGPGGSKVFYGKVSMKNLVIENPKHLLFEFVDLSRVEFRGTNLRGILFRHVQWDKLRGKILWLIKGRSRNSLYDERAVKQLLENTRKSKSSATDQALASLRMPIENEIDDVKKLYRELKQNYDDDKNFMEAEDFYYGEWEMARLKLPWWRRYFLSWEFFYWLVAGYGQRWENSFFWMLLLLSLTPLVFLLTGIEIKSMYHLSQADYWDALQYNFLNITFQRDIYSFFRPSIFTKNIAIIESFLMPVITAFFVLALRRKFKR